MLDLQFVCDNLEAVQANCRNRGVTIDLSQITSLRERRGQLIAEGDNLRREQKELSPLFPRRRTPPKSKS